MSALAPVLPRRWRSPARGAETRVSPARGAETHMSAQAPVLPRRLRGPARGAGPNNLCRRRPPRPRRRRQPAPVGRISQETAGPRRPHLAGDSRPPWATSHMSALAPVLPRRWRSPARGAETRVSPARGAETHMSAQAPVLPRRLRGPARGAGPNTRDPMVDNPNLVSTLAPRFSPLETSVASDERAGEVAHLHMLETLEPAFLGCASLRQKERANRA